jgi:nucleotide-binding universal stress UspA family protein
MAKLVIGAVNAELAAEATERALALLGAEHRVTVLFVANPALVAAPIEDSEGVTTARLALEDERGPEEVLASARRVEADARSDLDAALRRRHLGTDLRVRVETGEIGETVLRVATEEQADLVVVGRRGGGRARRLQRVIDASPCPVLVINTKEG